MQVADRVAAGVDSRPAAPRIAPAYPLVDDLDVAIMARSVRGQFVGVSRYTHDLVEAVAAQLARPPSVFLTRSADGLNGTHIRRIRAPFSTPNEYARAAWEQTVVPWQVAQLAPDVYHSPNYILPLGLRCPSVVTVHDLAFLERKLHALRSHVYLTVLATAAIGKATRIICVSDYTRQALVRRFPSAAGKARVVGEGVASRFVPQPRAAIDRFRRRFGLVDPYILFVGTIEPRKNVARLIDAFSTAVERHGLRHRLVIAGQLGWKNTDVLRAYRASPVRERIHFAGYVDDRELPAAYAGAEALVYPSTHEGFGLPPLEAMACGTPVITSNVTSLPEVVGDAALTVDPGSVGELTDALCRLLTSAALRDELSEAGQRRAAAFSWEDAAARSIAVYREAAA